MLKEDEYIKYVISEDEEKKEIGFLGAFIIGTFFWTIFLIIALKVYP